MLSQRYNCQHGPLSLFPRSQRQTGSNHKKSDDTAIPHLSSRNTITTNNGAEETIAMLWSCSFSRDGSQCHLAATDNRQPKNIPDVTHLEQSLACHPVKKFVIWNRVTDDGDDEEEQQYHNNKIKSWKKSRQSEIIPINTPWCTLCHCPVATVACHHGHINDESQSSSSSPPIVTRWNSISHVLRPLSDRKNNAQFFFSDETVALIVDWITRVLNVERVVCVGCPRIHEAILRRRRAPEEEEEEAATPTGRTKSLLLDWDDRLREFFPGTFWKFNMCNSYFATTRTSTKGLLGSSIMMRRIFRKMKRRRMMVVIDPPFGARVELLANTLMNFAMGGGMTTLPPTFIFSPHFHCDVLKRECAVAHDALHHITKTTDKNNSTSPNNDIMIPTQKDFRALHVEMDYVDNPYHQPRSRRGKKRKRNGPNNTSSPVRCFTNIAIPAHDDTTPLSSSPQQQRLSPPPSQHDKYEWCRECHSYVHAGRRHCPTCGVCPVGEARWVMGHCNDCAKCVRLDYRHCGGCGGCFPEETHVCFARERRRKGKKGGF